MPIITKISNQKKNKERYNIFLDYGNGEEFAFSVDEDVLIKFNLKKGLELDEFALTEINYQDEIRKSYSKAIQYLARRMRSEHEVRDYLHEYEVEEHVIDEVIHKLYQYQFLDDSQFAQAYVRTQMNTTDKGLDLIRRELQEKGIRVDRIEVALQEFPYDLQVSKAIALWEKAKNKASRDSERISSQKAEQHLVRKGYSFDLISIAKSESEVNKSENEEMDALRLQAEKAHRKYKDLEGFQYEQKMKGTLYRKGFPMEYIERYLIESKND